MKEKFGFLSFYQDKIYISHPYHIIYIETWKELHEEHYPKTPRIGETERDTNGHL